MQWLESGVFLPLRVAVNLSARQLQAPPAGQACCPGAERNPGCRPQRLELEITETAAMADVESSVTRLQELRQLGVKVSMDDFGTGYSCLSYSEAVSLRRAQD